ncbi:MAG: bifunctional phosphopantothenoylcysteine decarboxylase/phosphopantothenate--cysteine ligase CoaBC [Aigarchaeota archaeon]|nr:bifunctional phosphopantothenoylcysteine decarboxylase/phosphopantothenate--cysteine ligase CoaBC [Candidatus Pelearchaeum maunauluense]
MERHPSKEIIASYSDVLSGKRVALCITGSVAAYLAPEIARTIMRYGAEVYPVMTEEATELISPSIMEWATGNKPIVRLTGGMEHIKLAGEHEGRVDAIVVAPATANTISKAAHGIADNAVTTLLSVALGSGTPILIAPAMHEPMLRNRAVSDSIKTLGEMGVTFIEPRVEEGRAKVALPESICNHLVRLLHPKKLPSGSHVIVAAGATVEYIDPIRVVTNLSSGKLGLSIALESFRRGGDVTLLIGHSKIEPPYYINTRNVKTTQELREALREEIEKKRPILYFSTIAVADYRPAKSFERKLDTRSHGRLSVEFVRNEKVLPMIKELSPKTVVVAFKAEYNVGRDELIARARELLQYADAVYASDVSKTDSAFGSETSSGVIVARDMDVVWVEKERKDVLASRLLDVAQHLASL